jgi:hypothetical protein
MITNPLLMTLIHHKDSISRKYIAGNDNILKAISKITEYFSFNGRMSPVRSDGMSAWGSVCLRGLAEHRIELKR